MPINTLFSCCINTIHGILKSKADFCAKYPDIPYKYYTWNFEINRFGNRTVFHKRYKYYTWNFEMRDFHTREDVEKVVSINTIHGILEQPPGQNQTRSRDVKILYIES